MNQQEMKSKNKKIMFSIPDRTNVPIWFGRQPAHRTAASTRANIYNNSADTVNV